MEPLDYALFQRAMSAKLDQDLEGQTARLEQLLEAYPNSRLVVEALFQAGRTHIELNQLADAESKFLSLIEQHSATPRAKQALVELCLVGSNSDRTTKCWPCGTAFGPNTATTTWHQTLQHCRTPVD